MVVRKEHNGLDRIVSMERRGPMGETVFCRWTTRLFDRFEEEEGRIRRVKANSRSKCSSIA